ncbi:MAG: hypothetical protein ABW223_08465 [Rariglobus sp.]
MNFIAPRLLLLTSALLTLAACKSPLPKRDPALTGPFYTPTNVQAVPLFPVAVRRVALLPAASNDPKITEETLRALDRTLVNTLTRSARAEVATVPRDVLVRITGRSSILSTAVLPADFMKRVAAETGADGVVFVDVTTASAYPPLVLGLRSRLIDMASGQPLWHFDNVFSATDPTVVNSARAHNIQRTSASASPGNLTYTVLQNPLSFADYVSTATWATLPPR